jgi:hypothetical protein
MLCHHGSCQPRGGMSAVSQVCQWPPWLMSAAALQVAEFENTLRELNGEAVCCGWTLLFGACKHSVLAIFEPSLILSRRTGLKRGGGQYQVLDHPRHTHAGAP